MKALGAVAKLLVLGAAVAACDAGHRAGDDLPPCDEQAAAALDTTAWRAQDGRAFPSLALPAAFVLDRSLGTSCLHGGIGWRDTTGSPSPNVARSLRWCIEDRMPDIDAPERELRTLPAPKRPDDAAVCRLGFPVMGQRMALARYAEDADSTFWRWYTVPLEHGEPVYLLARGPSVSDEATIVRALRGMRWIR